MSDNVKNISNLPVDSDNFRDSSNSKYSEILRSHGLKVTLPRVKILDIMSNYKDRHVSAEDIYRILLEEDYEIGLATVYRVLNQFEECRIAVRHTFESNHYLFELTNKEQHDHIICTECGKVFEFNDEEIEARQREITKKHGLKLNNQSIYLYGSCQDTSKTQCDKDKKGDE